MNKSGTLTYRIAKKAPVGTHGAGSHAWAGRSCHTWGYLPKKLHSCTAGWLLLLLQSINGILKKSHMPTFVITKSDVMGIPVEIFECFLISSSFRPQKKIPLELHSVYSTDTSSDHATCRRGKQETMRPVKIFQKDATTWYTTRVSEQFSPKKDQWLKNTVLNCWLGISNRKNTCKHQTKHQKSWTIQKA